VVAVSEPAVAAAALVVALVVVVAAPVPSGEVA
jgi:hypothetical protein